MVTLLSFAMVSPDGAMPRPVAGRDSLGVMSEAMLADLVRDGVLDAELAGLVWLLAEARTPVLVVGPDAAARDRRPGRRGRGPAAGRSPGDRAPGRRLRVAARGRGARLAARAGRGSGRSRATRSPPPTASWSPGASGQPDGIAGERARIVVRALSLGYGLLADGRRSRPRRRVRDASATPPSGRTRTSARAWAWSLVLDVAARARVVAAHYVRPVARDPHGHVQRLPPAVLATWNPATERVGPLRLGRPRRAAVRGPAAPPWSSSGEQARRAVRARAIAPPTPDV